MRAFIWFADGNRIGHSSLELTNGTYISWWPADNKNSGKKMNKLGAHFVTGYNQETLQDDIEAEGGSPTKVVDLDDLGLNEEEMEEYWTGFISGGTYTLLGTNCCKVVYDVLRAGGASISINVVWSPGILYRYIVRLKQGWLSMIGSFFDSTPI